MPKPCLTKELAEILVQGEEIVKVESPSLRLTKYVRVKKSSTELPPKPDNRYATKQENDAWKNLKAKEDALKKSELSEVQKVYNAHARLPEKSGYALRLNSPEACSFVLKTGARLMVNMAKGFHENANINLHRNFGYPEIPGSVVKGCAAHCAREILWSEETSDEKQRNIAKKIIRIFGFPTNDEKLDNFLRKNIPEKEISNCAGKIAFFSAIPWLKRPSLEIDVLTPHHSQYYKGEKRKATDDEAPVPSFFLSIAAGSEFLFSLKIVNDGTPNDLAFAKDILKKSLIENGIGAKTAAGYGWFEACDKTPTMKDIK